MAHDYVTPYTLTACMSLALSDISYIVTIYSTNNRCYLTIKSHPNNLFMGVTSWYEIWEVAILVNAMCIRAGKKGVFKILSVGKSKVLHASLSNSDSRLAGVPMASPTLVPRFGGQSYRKLITVYPSLRV